MTEQMVCVVDDCNNPVAVIKRMLCRNHASVYYNKMKETKPCTWPNCETHQYAKGLCHLHYGRSRSGTPMDYDYESMRNRTCRFEGCERPVNNRQTELCQTHHRQYKVHGELKPVQVRPGVVEGERTCNRCNITKSLAEFYKRVQAGKEFWSGQCKPCRREMQKEYRLGK